MSALFKLNASQLSVWKLLLLSSAVMALVACQDGSSGQMAAYKVTYTEDSTPREGKSLFTLSVTDSSDAPVTG